MRKNYNRDTCSSEKHIAFITRKHGVALVKIYLIGSVSIGKPIEIYETNGNGLRKKLINKMKEMDKIAIDTAF